MYDNWPSHLFLILLYKLIEFSGGVENRTRVVLFKFKMAFLKVIKLWPFTPVKDGRCKILWRKEANFKAKHIAQKSLPFILILLSLIIGISFITLVVSNLWPYHVSLGNDKNKYHSYYICLWLCHIYYVYILFFPHKYWLF